MVVIDTLAPAVTVDDSPAVPSTMNHPPNYEGGTVVQDQDPGDLDSVVQIQGPVPQANPFQEVNLFIGAYCATFRLAPMAAVKQIMDMLQAIDQQTYHAGGAKGLGAINPNEIR